MIQAHFEVLVGLLREIRDRLPAPAGIVQNRSVLRCARCNAIVTEDGECPMCPVSTPHKAGYGAPAISERTHPECPCGSSWDVCRRTAITPDCTANSRRVSEAHNAHYGATGTETFTCPVDGDDTFAGDLVHQHRNPGPARVKPIIVATETEPEGDIWPGDLGERPGPILVNETVRRALHEMLHTLDGWIDGAMANHAGNGHPTEVSGEECWTRFHPDDIRNMVNDTARTLGVAEVWKAPS